VALELIASFPTAVGMAFAPMVPMTLARELALD
jgi:hypothetical protein